MSSSQFSTPTGSSSTPSGPKKMSSSLRERLKKQGRCHGISPRSPATPEAVRRSSSPVPFRKILTLAACSPRGSISPVSTLNAQTPTKLVSELRGARRCILGANDLPVGSSLVPAGTSPKGDPGTLQMWLDDIKAKAATLSKLRMVKRCRSTSNLSELESLTCRWRLACRRAIMDLINCLPDPKPSIGELVDCFGIQHKLIGYNTEEEDFDAIEAH